MYNFNLSFIRDEITQKTDNGVEFCHYFGHILGGKFEG